ncbi:hypothetical protein [Micromonospora yangpuensis]|uniref:Uncharacterized protein n=1 Tax=Micromonospora yangpuensis TaxID=683228 RepID=A0A1C6TYV6_9ACTN|nr:hypothetical protein [Micromonospora yangpuensis]GGM20806.1 hypothetical protein GCM10012279_44040 [Micromonospora yangpuensis]SCL47020.1 hypothetical protein GA0070617_0453 [Micromonospora yangpuensis]
MTAGPVRVGVGAQFRAGDVLHVTRAASIQFSQRPIMFRLIRVKTDWITYDGWTWLDGYQLDEQGNATARRSIFVQWAGLRLMAQPAPPAAGDGRNRHPNQRRPPVPRRTG